MNLEEIILGIMREVFDTTDVNEQTSQRNCENWDSLRHLSLASELEEAFDIELEPEEIGQMTDFSAVVETVRAKQ